MRFCGRKIFPGAWIAAHRERWGHARCVGGMRADVRSWLEERAREHPDVEISLRIAAGYEASGDEEGARRCRADAEAATRKLVAPFQRVPPDLEEEEWYPDEDPLLIRASYLLREVARGAVPAAELTGEAGRCLQQLDLGSAADMIRSMPIGGAPDGPATPEAATARRALEILGEASRVRRARRRGLDTLPGTDHMGRQARTRPPQADPHHAGRGLGIPPERKRRHFPWLEI